MIYRVIYLTQVQNDLQEAYIHYEEQRIGPGEEFIEQVQRVVEYISNYPLHFQIIIEESRKSNLIKFPYAVFYIVEGDIIKITSVMHLHSDPEKWAFYQ